MFVPCFDSGVSADEKAAVLMFFNQNQQEETKRKTPQEVAEERQKRFHAKLFRQECHKKQ